MAAASLSKEDSMAAAGTAIKTARETTWRQLLQWAAIAGMAEYVVVMATAKAVIPPVLVIFLVLLVGMAMLRRPGRAAVIVTMVAFVLFFVSNLLFAGSNFSAPRSFPSWMLIVAASVTGLVGLTAAVATLQDRRSAGTPLTIARAAVALILIATVANLAGSLTYKDASREAGDVALSAKDTKFAPAMLTAKAGRVTFFINNKDLQLHNFHIKGFSAVLLPASHRTRPSFDLRSGTYSYLCDLHSDMKGTLAVN
jgi:plastocyanin